VAIDLGPAARAIYRARYQASVREADMGLHNLFRFLEDAHLAESSIIVITADHGESFGEDDLITHNFRDLGDYESTHHVPLIVVLPQQYGIAPALRREVVSIADIAPTVYDLLGVDWTDLRNRYGEAYGESRMHGARPYSSRIHLAPERTTADTAAARERERQLRALGYLH
jgi:arylsulfatase A-like enzyme